MKIILIITVLETLALALWMLTKHRRHPRLEIAQGRLDNRVREEITQVAMLPSPDLFDFNRRAFIHSRQISPQADDRTPMQGAVIDGAGPPAVRRSVSRRTHQLRFKEWSQNRRSGTE